MNDFRNGARERVQHLLNRAKGGAQGGYSRFRAYLMRQPPLQRSVLIVLWACAALAGLLLVYVLILIPVTPGIRDLKQARAARASTLVSADGKELASFDQGLQERVKLAQISPNVISALV
ncbi:MAG: transglycosylase family protein, partial [Massilia sp.]|nr:transglycosylase family protein [Massilia sp.]